MKNIVISKTPYRLCLGGATDLIPYVKKFGGHGLSATIDKYVTIVVRRRPDAKMLFHYALGTEEGAHREEIGHPYVREVMRHVGMKGGVDIASFTDIPFASGLGSSGAFTVGLLNALWVLKGVKKSPRELAEEAAHVELNALKSPIGKHDQYLAAFGGICDLRFRKDGSVDVKKIILSPAEKKKFEDHLLLVYSNMTRSASTVLSPIFGQLERGEGALVESMHNFRKVGEEMVRLLRRRDFIRFGDALNSLWEIQKPTFGSSNERLDALIASGRNSGAVSGLVSGAGGGGFLFFVCPDARVKRKVSRVLARMDAPSYPFSITERGSRIVYTA